MIQCPGKSNIFYRQNDRATSQFHTTTKRVTRTWLNIITLKRSQRARRAFIFKTQKTEYTASSDPLTFHSLSFKRRNNKCHMQTVTDRVALQQNCRLRLTMENKNLYRKYVWHIISFILNKSSQNVNSHMPKSTEASKWSCLTPANATVCFLSEYTHFITASLNSSKLVLVIMASCPSCSPVTPPGK